MRVIAAIAVVLLLSGCVPTSPDASPTPSPTPAPVFASEEEALAAAEEAYAAYLAVSNAVFADGGAHPERLESVATGEFLTDEIAGFERVRENGWRSVGLTTYRNVVLQTYSELDRVGVVGIYVCEDVSAVDVIDSAGVSVVSSARPDTTTLQVLFDLSASDGLLISSREAWSNDPC